MSSPETASHKGTVRPVDLSKMALAALPKQWLMPSRKPHFKFFALFRLSKPEY